jgi:hypothetical protein
MSFRNAVTIIASPRPRVGKTLLARLLTDFHRHEGRAVAAFDLNNGDGTLAQFLPGQASEAAVGEIKGEMALFDRLIADDGIAKVVDVGAESFANFFAVAGKIGFAEEAQRRAIAPSLLYMMTPDRTAVDAYRDIRARSPAMLLTPVHNEMLGAPPRDKYVLIGSGTVVLKFPALPPGLRKFIDTPPFSFVDEGLAQTRGMPAGSQSELERWLRRIYLEFRELDLRILLADLQSSIGFRSQ